MARAAKLKVYRTAIGFHDAYVAAANQKAALQAWGSEKNLFARGVAELVTDPALIEEPLASPGTVIKRLRGSAAEQMAALPPNQPRRNVVDKIKASLAKPRPVPKLRRVERKPPPSRAKLEQADAVLEAFDAQARDRLADLTRREKELANEKKKLLGENNVERVKLTDRRNCEADAYDRALRQWGSD